MRPALGVAFGCLWTAACLAVLTVPGRPSAAADPALAAAPVTVPLVEYLATWKIDRGSLAVLEDRSAWSPAKQEMAIKVLARLSRLPAQLAAQWNADAVDLRSLSAAQRVQDLFVKLDGRATFVATVPLTEEEAEVAGRRQMEIVRIVSDDGMTVDVLADHVPKAWPRAASINEPAAVIGLPLSEGSGPVVPAGDDQAPAVPAVLIAAPSVGWFPQTPLGALGMDYGLFDSVVDGQKLVAGDTEAFYAGLAAMGRATAAGVASAAGPPGDVVPLINPASDWFAQHRGDPVTVAGVARRATRIEVDDPLRQRQIGTDHYWELFVFVPTPLLKVHGKLQDNYPVVCCVRTLPEGMPTGQQIGERVRVSGFAFKRYGYPLPDVKISSSQGNEEQKGQRQETALLIGREAVWLPAPSPTREVNALGWVFLSIAAVIGLALALAAWSFARDSRRRDRQARTELPDRIELP
jgi:hypothetical protein